MIFNSLMQLINRQMLLIRQRLRTKLTQCQQILKMAANPIRTGVISPSCKWQTVCAYRPASIGPLCVGFACSTGHWALQDVQRIERDVEKIESDGGNAAQK